jgi:hypothetical protein
MSTIEMETIPWEADKLRIGEGMVFREKSRRVFKYCAIIL